MYELQIITPRKEHRRTYQERRLAKRAYHNRLARPAGATEVCLHDLAASTTLNTWRAPK